MNERERADWLARAIDGLVLGQRPADPPTELDEAELQALLEIARGRLDAARSAAHAGLQHEGAVWQQVLSKLQLRVETGSAGSSGATDSITDAGDFAVFDDPEDSEVEDLKDIVMLRRQMAAEMASLAEAHRDAVWQQVQSRIEASATEQGARKHGGLFSALRPDRAAADEFAPVFDRVATGRPVGHSGDPQVDDLVRIAQARRELAQLRTPSAEREDRMWARIRTGLSAQIFGGSVARARETAPRSTQFGRRLAFAGAAAALIVAAVGPIPATGLADHPVAQFVRFVGGHIGVRETATQPPLAPSGGSVVEGWDLTAQEASTRLGVPVREPATLPAGITQVSAQFFSQAMTATEGGMFVLSYSAKGGGTLVIYQERAGGSDIAAVPGTVSDLTLPDGTAATYIGGSWRAAAGGFTWNKADSGTLTFDRGGVRTVIVYSGSPPDPGFLLSVAGSMAFPQSTAASR